MTPILFVSKHHNQYTISWEPMDDPRENTLTISIHSTSHDSLPPSTGAYAIALTMYTVSELDRYRNETSVTFRDKTIDVADLELLHSLVPTVVATYLLALRLSDSEITIVLQAETYTDGVNVSYELGTIKRSVRAMMENDYRSYISCDIL